jgi:hypothetical protein
LTGSDENSVQKDKGVGEGKPPLSPVQGHSPPLAGEAGAPQLERSDCIIVVKRKKISGNNDNNNDLKSTLAWDFGIQLAKPNY